MLLSEAKYRPFKGIPIDGVGGIIPEPESQNIEEWHINKIDKYLEYLNPNNY